MSLLELVQDAVKKGAQAEIMPETLFGFTYWSHMIPPMKPDHTCILGYGKGRAAELMRKIWGQMKITGVDIQDREYDYIEYKMKVMDALEFMKDCTTGLFKTKFDYICVDLWNGSEIPKFMFEPEFSVRLSEMSAGFVCMNIKRDQMRRIMDFMEDYGGFFLERGDLVGQNAVLWWSAKSE